MKRSLLSWRPSRISRPARTRRASIPANIMENTLESMKQKKALTEGLDVERIRGRLNQDDPAATSAALRVSQRRSSSGSPTGGPDDFALRRQSILSGAIDRESKMKPKAVQLGFKTSIIGLFVAIVLVIGLTLVYLSFERITAVTEFGRQPVHRQGGGIVGGPDRFAIETGAGQSRNPECAAADSVRGDRG